MKVEKLNFKAGPSEHVDPLTIHPGRVTIFIGPNNGGKSRVLKEIQEAISPITGYKNYVLKSSEISPITDREFEQRIKELIRPKKEGENASDGTVAFEGKGGRQIVHLSLLAQGRKSGADVSERQYLAQHFLRYFYIDLNGHDRLGLANPVQIEPVGSTPTNTVSAIWQNDKARESLSKIVHKAFGQYLVIDPTKAPQLGYKLSLLPPDNNVEKRFDIEAASFFENAMALSDASDGTRAFVGLLGEIMVGDPDIIFVDELEAFLHPSLQFLLGQQIASQTSTSKQVFAATHSSAFLLGCVLSGHEVDVIRLTHKSGAATARHLGWKKLSKLMTDPLFRSIGASTALFYEGAVIVEGDSDRAFYDEINTRMTRFSQTGMNHVIFLNAHNKQTVVNIASPLREIGVPSAFILDIDWVKEDGQVWDRFFKAAGAPVGLKDSMAAARRTVRSYLEKASKNYKRDGGVSLLKQDELETANAFFDQMEEYGLFTVRSGELESWLSFLNVDRSKSKWLVSVFDAMGSDPSQPSYLKPAADDVWSFMGRVAKWVYDSSRKGM
ncbi:ATP-dependent nuclease [Sphingomonas sp. NPDC079357]|uniref:ATP-dependent nuclease n=1 Tax=Sphingomonas sp. NPDC079357 TaxID=3364518 RepID=UPI00384BA408